MDIIIRKSKITYSSLLYFLCIMIPVIQIINSLFLFSDGESSFGKIYRLIIFFVSFFITIKLSKKQSIWICILTIMNGIVVLYDFGSGVAIYDTFLNMIKLLSPYILITAFVGLAETGKINIEYFDKMLKTLMLFIPLSIIIPRILGIGYERYEGSGYQGLYFENNALVIVIVVVFIYSLENLYRKRDLKNLFCVFLTTFSMVVNGSKSSMAMFAVITILYILRYIFVLNPGRFPIRLAIIIFLFTGLAILLYPIVYPLVEKRIDAYMYYYIGGVKVNGGSVLDFLTNGRTAFVEYYFSRFYTKNSTMNILFGIQKYGEIRVEMDAIDIFLYFGILVLMLLVIYMLKVVRSLKYTSFMIRLMFWSIIIYSLLAGHVWNSSLAGLPFSLVLAIVISARKLNRNSSNCDCAIKYFK